MMSSIRKVGDRRPAEPAIIPEDAEFESAPAPRLPSDPALLVATRMLVRAVAALPPDSPAINAPGSIAIIHTPSADWTDVAKQAWRFLAHDGAEPRSEADRWWDHSIGWTAFVREQADCSSNRVKSDRGNQQLAEALWRGNSVGGFSPDPDEMLPRDLLHAADFRLEMGVPTPEDLVDALRGIVDGPATSTLTVAEAAALTPRVLRLARRPGQTADAYLGKLRQLLALELEVEASVKPALTPRDEPTLDRLHGMKEATDWGHGVATDLREYAAGRLPWSEVGGHACLLSGPPGCGKSLFARALAASCGVPLVTGSYGQWHASGSSHQGDLLKAMRRTFAEAAKLAPSILFIDEIDSFPNRATITHAWADWEIQVVNALLELIDGGAGREGVIVVGACNQPHLLDAALVRSGRLDKHLRIGLPDQDGLERIVREHLADDIPGERLSGVALSLAGSTGADVERIVRGARGRARKAARAMVLHDLLMEVDGDDERTPEELWQAAVHEAGHAVALCEYAPGTLLAVTLHATGDRGAGTVAVRPGGTFLVTDVARSLVCMLAGRAAEQVMLREASSGAGGGPDSDLATATLAAAISASAVGFSTVQGLVWSGIPTVATLPGMLERSPTLAAEVKRTLGEAYETALELVSRKTHQLKALAAALVERRALDQVDVHAILDGARPGDVP